MLIVTVGVQAIAAAIRNAGGKRALANTIGKRDGVVIQRANQADFTDEAWREVQSLQHNANGETISNAASGRKIHRGFKVGTQDRILRAGRTTGKYGFVDSIDYVNKVIYELKPNNSKSITLGIQQLHRYGSQMQAYKLVLVLY